MERSERPAAVEQEEQEHIEQLIDEALEETFPASDPPSPAVGVAPGRGEEEIRKEGKTSRRW